MLRNLVAYGKVISRYYTPPNTRGKAEKGVTNHGKSHHGDTGSGKTKQLIDLANAAVKTEHGNVICIEPKSELTYDIDYNIRLIAANDYELPSYEAFKGFLSGMYAGNYDITHVFVDNLTKIIRDNNETQVERFLDWLDAFSEKNRIKFTITMSAKADWAADGITKYT